MRNRLEIHIDAFITHHTARNTKYSKEKIVASLLPVIPKGWHVKSDCALYTVSRQVRITGIWFA
jgi:hypothetical protein